MFPSKMLKMFEAPAVGAVQQFAKEMSGITGALMDLRATFPTVGVPPSFCNVVMPSRAVEALTAGVRIESLLGLEPQGRLSRGRRRRAPSARSVNRSGPSPRKSLPAFAVSSPTCPL